MSGVNLDAPEHRLCSDALALRDREIQFLRNTGAHLLARAEKAEADRDQLGRERDAAVDSMHAWEAHCRRAEEAARVAEAEVARLRGRETAVHAELEDVRDELRAMTTRAEDAEAEVAELRQALELSGLSRIACIERADRAEATLKRVSDAAKELLEQLEEGYTGDEEEVIEAGTVLRDALWPRVRATTSRSTTEEP